MFKIALFWIFKPTFLLKRRAILTVSWLRNDINSLTLSFWCIVQKTRLHYYTSVEQNIHIHNVTALQFPHIENSVVDFIHRFWTVHTLLNTVVMWLFTDISLIDLKLSEHSVCQPINHQNTNTQRLKGLWGHFISDLKKVSLDICLIISTNWKWDY